LGNLPCLPLPEEFTHRIFRIGTFFKRAGNVVRNAQLHVLIQTDGYSRFVGKVIPELRFLKGYHLVRPLDHLDAVVHGRKGANVGAGAVPRLDAGSARQDDAAVFDEVVDLVLGIELFMGDALDLDPGAHQEVFSSCPCLSEALAKRTPFQAFSGSFVSMMMPNFMATPLEPASQ
jgi:hypothetical protein